MLDDLTTPTVDTRRDQWGRYLVLAPGGKKPEGYARATTVAKALDDQQSLIDWKARMVALGLTRRPDLLALASALDPDDKKKLNDICERAAETGGATSRRDLGTAVHGLLEAKIKNPDYEVPPTYAADIDAILSALDTHGYDLVPGGSERMVVLDRYKIAGTADLFVQQRATGRIYVADLKTGSSVAFGALGWAIQLAIYAHADCFYTQGAAKDGSDDRRTNKPPVDLTTAIILHCQPGSGSCDVHGLDIAAGWNALTTAIEVRKWRSRKDLLTAINAPKKHPTIADDVATLTAEPMPSVPKIAVDGPEQPERAAELIARLTELDDRSRTIAGQWAKEAADAGHPISIRQNPCERRCSIVELIVEWAPMGDEIMRALIGDVIGEDSLQNFPTGALLGALTLPEVTRALESVTSQPTDKGQ